MLNILHFADAHIGIENYGTINPQTGLNTRLEDFLSSLDFIVNYSVENNIDLIIFAGDAFKNQNPNSTQQHAFANRIQKLSKANIPLVLLVGNHDQSNRKGEANSLNIYDTLEIENVYLGYKPDFFTIKTKSGDVQVATLPYVTSSFLLTKEQYQSKSKDEIKDVLISKISGIVDYFVKKINPDIPSVLCAHISLDEASTGSEQELMIGKGFTVPLSSIARKEFSYVALGHIHKYQVLSKEPPVVYSGSTERVDFGEEKDPKGFMHVTIDGPDCTYKFIPVPTRPFFTIKADLREKENLMESLIAEINAAKGSYETEENRPIVRLQYTIESNKLGLINEKQIWEALSFAAFAILRPVIVYENSRVRLPSLNETISSTPIDALEEYLNWNSIYKDKQEELVDKTRFLLGIVNKK